jgi:hypothetical protein
MPGHGTLEPDGILYGNSVVQAVFFDKEGALLGMGWPGLIEGER